MYILDTNICIYIIKRKFESVLSKIRENRFSGISISSITLTELEHGVANSIYPEKNSIALLEFLSEINVMPFDELAAKEYGIIKTDLKKRNCIIGPLDTLIAAHAKSLNSTLVTNNTGEFSRVQGLKKLNLLLLLPAIAAFYEKGKAFPSLQPPANLAAKQWAFSATPSCPDWAAIEILLHHSHSYEMFISF
jgi:tRNA(fMet)-specific endonuclease VapC